MRETVEVARRLLRETVDAAPITVVELCARLGWTRSYYYDIFRRRQDLKLVHILAILREVGVPPADFFTRLARRYQPGGDSPEGVSSGCSLPAPPARPVGDDP